MSEAGLQPALPLRTHVCKYISVRNNTTHMYHVHAQDACLSNRSIMSSLVLAVTPPR